MKNTIQSARRPYRYYDVMRQSKDPKCLRLKMVTHARAYGIKAAANTHQKYFNLARKNSGKENKTPWERVQEKQSDAAPTPPILPVAYFDQLHSDRLHSKKQGVHDVWGHPSFPAAVEN